jgi:hypothetical protein
MLQPTNRLTLIDAMRPPTGYAFDEAMAVTFTLDLRALLAAPAAFVLARTGEADGATGSEGHAEPIELIHAIRANAGRITVFSQAGEIALPPSRRVFSFLEGSVVAVTAPRGGVVHPKVWVLRYVDPDGSQPPQLRVLGASRNLTFDTSWDTVLRLDTTDADHAGPTAALDPIADLFDTLAQRAVGQLADVHQGRVRSLGAALRERRFALPTGVEQLEVHVLGTAPSPAPFPDTADRSLVISPFVSDDFFARVHPGGVDELVSRVEYLSSLSPEALAAVGVAHVFDDGSTPDLEDPDGVAASDPARPLRGLHAKVFAFETGPTARLFCGSANATGAAFDANLEVLFEMTGPTGLLGIDALCEGTDDERGLRHLFVPYRPLTEDLEADAEDPLASVRRAIGRLELTGDVESSGSGWAVTYRSHGPLPDRPELSIWCWPLTSPGNRRPVEPGQPLEARFETSLEGISGFLVIEVADEAGVLTHSLLPTTLRGVPEGRDRQLLRSLVGSADRFLRYLLALLSDGPDDLGLLDVLDRATDDRAAGDQRSTTSLPVLEHLVRTLRRDPARLAAVDPLVTDLAADDALPPGFADLWQQLQVVAAQRGRR